MAPRGRKNHRAARAARGGPVVGDDGAASTTTGSLASTAAGEGAYRSLDPLDPRRVSFDIFEVYCHEMLASESVTRRAYLVNKMRYMVNRLLGYQLAYGCLYNRTCVANIISRVCARHPYEVPDEIEGKWQLADRLVDISPRKWKMIADQFEKLRTDMLRNDAALVVLPSEMKDDDEKLSDSHEEGEEPLPEEDDSVNEALESHADFNANYEMMMDRVKFHHCLSHLQPELATAIRMSPNRRDSVVVPRDNIIAFEAAIDEQFGDAGDRKYRRILKSLLEGGKKINRTTRHHALKLKPYHVIETIYFNNSLIFDLKLFQDDLLNLIRRWSRMVLPFPALSKLNYGSAHHGDIGGEKSTAGVDNKENVSREDEIGKKPSSFALSTMVRQQPNKTEQVSPVVSDNLFDVEVEDEIESSSEDEKAHSTDARQNLNRKMKELMKHVKDPLDECVAVARSARPGQHLGQTQGDDDSSSEDDDREKPVQKNPPLCQKRKTAYQIKFDDSDDSEEEAVALSEVPARYEHAKSFQAFPEIHVKPHPPKKRKKFTEEEDGVIRAGVKQFGAGHWAEIKANFAIILKDRDAVAIKDRWRTINKQT